MAGRVVIGLEFVGADGNHGHEQAGVGQSGQDRVLGAGTGRVLSQRGRHRWIGPAVV